MSESVNRSARQKISCARRISITFTFFNSILILFITALSGCGYSTKSLLPPHIKTVYVKTLANKIDITEETGDRRRYPTYRPLLEVDITKAIIDRFLFDGNVRIASSEQTADSVIIGELVDFKQDPLRYDDGGNVEEYRISIVVNVALKDLKKDEIMWEEESFTGDTTYFIRGSKAESEANALDRAVKDIARRIVEKTVEGW